MSSACHLHSKLENAQNHAKLRIASPFLRAKQLLDPEPFEHSLWPLEPGPTLLVLHLAATYHAQAPGSAFQILSILLNSKNPFRAFRVTSFPDKSGEHLVEQEAAMSPHYPHSFCRYIVAVRAAKSGFVAEARIRSWWHGTHHQANPLSLGAGRPTAAKFQHSHSALSFFSPTLSQISSFTRTYSSFPWKYPTFSFVCIKSTHVIFGTARYSWPLGGTSKSTSMDCFWRASSLLHNCNSDF